jgi:hypothetical protein
MDRFAFLSSVPCLIPLPSTVWPPEGDNSSVLLEDSPFSSRAFQLSIESILPTTAGTAVAEQGGNKPSSTDVCRPMFFAKTGNCADPAMTPVQMCTVTEKSGGSTVYLRVEMKVYVIDLQSVRIQTVSEQYHDADGDDDDCSHRKRPCRPTCLLLDFQRRCPVRFRIFRNDLGDVRDDRGTLDAVCKTLKDLGPFLAPVHDPIDEDANNSSSPSRHSTAGSSATMSDINPSSPNLLNASSNSKKRRPLSEEECVARVQRKTKASMDCHQRLATLHQVLQMPASSLPTNEDEFASTNSLGPLLTKVAELQATSFVTGAEMDLFQSHLDCIHQEQQVGMDAVLGKFFPAPRQRVPPPQPALSGAQAAEALREYLTKHKKITEERHKLLLLPRRG